MNTKLNRSQQCALATKKISWAALDKVSASKAREVSQGKAEAQEKQNDAKTKTTKSKGDEADSPGKILAGDDSAPRQDACRPPRQGSRRRRQQGHC